MSDALQCLRNIREPFEEKMTVWRVSYGLLLTIISITSIFMNVNLTIVVLQNDTFHKSLRLYLLSATVAGIIGVLPILFSLIPTIFFRAEIRDPWNLIVSVPDFISFITFMMTTTAIALDRLIFFVLPKIHLFLNNSKTILPCLAALPTITSIIAIAHMFTLGCYRRTDPYALVFTSDCGNCKGNYRTALSYAGIIFPVANLGIYIIVFCRILAIRMVFHTRINGSSTRTDISLIIQFTLICLSQFGSSGFLPLLTPYIHKITSLQLGTIFSAINTMINPLVIFALHKRMRSTCLSLFRLTKATSSTLVLAPVNASVFVSSATHSALVSSTVVAK